MRKDVIRRLVYASRATSSDVASDHRSILISSVRNNGMDGVTGVLWADGGRYLQLLEGPPESVGHAFDRISRDNRHSDVVVMNDTEADQRAFGDWAMAGLPGSRPVDTEDRLRLLLRDASVDIQRFFPAFATA